jgi:hypothetical protein
MKDTPMTAERKFGLARGARGSAQPPLSATPETWEELAIHKGQSA